LKTVEGVALTNFCDGRTTDGRTTDGQTPQKQYVSPWRGRGDIIINKHTIQQLMIRIG